MKTEEKVAEIKKIAGYLMAVPESATEEEIKGIIIGAKDLLDRILTK